MLKVLIAMMLTLSSLAYKKTAFSGSKFFYIDQADRIEILTDLYKQTEAEYALWTIKKRRINVDGHKVFKDAISKEQGIDNVIAPIDQAFGNLSFLSRVKETVAKFRDTHFGVRPVISTPWIVSGYSTSLVDGKIIVSGIYDKVISKTSLLSSTGAYLSAVSVGDEVVEVNGESALSYSKKFRKFINASSFEYRDIKAAGFILERYFAYPKKPFIDVKIAIKKLNKTVSLRLPLYYSDKSQRRDARFFFEENGFIPLADLRFKWNDKENKWEKDSSLKFRGYRGGQLPSGAIELSKWTSEKSGGSTVVRSALILKDAKVYGFLQLNSFAVTTLYKGEIKSDFLSSIRKAVKYFKDQKLDIILDLRNNGGGNGKFPEAVLSILTEQGKSYPGPTWAKRITRYTRQFIDFYNTDELFNEIDNEDFWQDMIDHIFISARDKVEHTPAMSGAVIVKDDVVDGYEGKVVAMISPNCISACDIMSMLLKISKRATLIGTTANGTGAGYWSNDKLSTNFEDRYHVIAGNIPNSLFGYPSTLGKTIFEKDSAYLLNSENRAVVADINYVEVKKDITENSSGWIGKAIEVLQD